jgi:hypothetical protein
MFYFIPEPSVLFFALYNLYPEFKELLKFDNIFTSDLLSKFTIFFSQDIPFGQKLRKKMFLQHRFMFQRCNQ